MLSQVQVTIQSEESLILVIRPKASILNTIIEVGVSRGKVKQLILGQESIRSRSRLGRILVLIRHLSSQHMKDQI